MSTGLFSPITLRDLAVPDRLWVSPMCQYSAHEGVLSPWHTVHLGGFATGGASLIISEATAVSPEGRISPGDAGIWNDAQAEAWADAVDFVHEQGALIALQLAHAGRKASARIPWIEGPSGVDQAHGGWQPVAPSPIAFGDLTTPLELSREDINTLVANFAHSAARSVAAGFDALEIHAAHGYVLHEFLSPVTNQRTDEYGGDFAGRILALTQVVDAVRGAVPEGMPLMVRISATDWIEGGWSVEDSVRLCDILVGHGVDFIDVSSGGIDLSQKIDPQPGFQVPFATRIKNEVGVSVGAVGLITNSAQADTIVREGHADVVLAGRAFLREPTLARRFAQELGVTPRWPSQYLRARP